MEGSTPNDGFIEKDLEVLSSNLEEVNRFVQITQSPNQTRILSTELIDVFPSLNLSVALEGLTINRIQLISLLTVTRPF